MPNPHLPSILAIFALALSSAEAGLVPTHAGADLALGALDFDNPLVSVDPGPINMAAPYAVAVDRTSGKVFVSDSVFNRVLRFASADSLKTGEPAEIAFGQADLLSDIGNLPAADSLLTPAGIAVDAAGRLWVADSSHHRVVMYKNAATVATSGPAASLVLGQPDLATGLPNTTQAGMYRPTGICVDSNGRLWVADSQNNRVLRFDNAAEQSNGANADGVLGQQGFETANPGASNQQLSDPTGVTMDATGTLWVADRINDRILAYPSAATISNGTNAARILGQPDFNTTAGACTEKKVDGPWDVFADAANNLWVVDANNNRVLRYAGLASIENGAAADAVIGQADFVSSVQATSAKNLFNPRGLFVQPDGRLWVADFTNRRALRYATLDSPIPVDTISPVIGIRGKAKVKTKKTRVVLRGIASDNTGVTLVTIKNGRTAAPAIGTDTWKRTVRLKKPRTVVQAVAYDAAGNVSTPAKFLILRKPKP